MGISWAYHFMNLKYVTSYIKRHWPKIVLLCLFFSFTPYIIGNSVCKEAEFITYIRIIWHFGGIAGVKHIGFKWLWAQDVWSKQCTYASKSQVTSLGLSSANKHLKHSKNIYSTNEHNTHGGLDIRASLGLSSNRGVGDFSAAFQGARRPTWWRPTEAGRQKRSVELPERRERPKPVCRTESRRPSGSDDGESKQIRRQA